jgi:hypothetical protein
MPGFTEQLPALVGVVVGASASYLIGAATDRARWQRGQSARWDERRAQAYADYGYAVKALYMQGVRISNSRGPGPGREMTGAGGRARTMSLRLARTAGTVHAAGSRCAVRRR